MQAESVRDALDRLRWLCAFVDRMDREQWTSEELHIVLINVDHFAREAMAATGVDDPDARAMGRDMPLALDDELSALAEAIQPTLKAARRRRRK